MGQILQALFRQNSQGGIRGQAHRVLREEKDLMVRTCKASKAASVVQGLEALGLLGNSFALSPRALCTMQPGVVTGL